MPAPTAIPLDIAGTGMVPFHATTDAKADFGRLIGNILSPLMVVALLILLVYLIWGAFEWLTSGGDSAKLQTARNRMLHAIVGILILSSVLALFMFVQYLLGIQVLTFNFSGVVDGTCHPSNTNICPNGNQ